MPIDPDDVDSRPATNLVEMLGIEIVDTTPDRVVARLAVGPQHMQPYGIVHGGTYCTMAESVASYGAAHAAIELGGRGAVGQSNHTDFLKATRAGTITATATPVHVGRSVQLWSVDLTDDDDNLVAQSKVRLFNLMG